VASFWKKLLNINQSEPKQTVQEAAAALAEPSDRPTDAAQQEAAEPGVSIAPPARATREISMPAELSLKICLQSDVGLVRTNNEDRGFYTLPPDSDVAGRKGTLVVVADGMGGASAGEVAAELAIRLIPDAYYGSPDEPGVALKRALELASSEIYSASQGDPGLRGMGTTCVALVLRQSEAFMAYVGDSRLYLLREGQFYQLTDDHSVVYEMVRQGLLTREQARTHEERNVLSLSMGGRPEISASGWDEPMSLREGDRFLLCSDGLHDLVSDERMQLIVGEFPPEEATLRLIEAAKEGGGHDNITAAIVQVYNAAIASPPEPRGTRELIIATQ
jgi:serine/threonine protein phosphatase PrpC